MKFRTGRRGLKAPVGLIFAVVIAVLGVGRADAQPDNNLAPLHGSISMKPGATPNTYSKNLTAGGPIRTNLGGMAAYVSKAPSMQLNYVAGAGPLTIRASSGKDTTLLVNLPDGQWIANDDGDEKLNPKITLARPQPGRYDIYVGAFGADSAPATLFIEESQNAQPAPPPPVGKTVAFLVRAVDDQTKRDIGGVEMALVDAAGKTIATARESVEGQVHSYRFELTPGRHRVAIAKGGYLSQSTVIMVGADGRDPIQIVSLTRAAQPQPPQPQQPPVAKPVAYLLRAVDDQTKRDIGGVEMALVDASGMRIATARESVEGQVHHYRFDLMPGRHRVAIGKNGYLPQSILIMVSADGRDPTQIVSLTRAEQPQPPQPQPPPIAKPVAYLLRTVDDQTKRDIAGVEMTLVDAAGKRIATARESVEGQVHYYRFDLMPGRHRVAIGKNGYLPQSILIMVSADDRDPTQIVSLTRAEQPKPPQPQPPPIAKPVAYLLRAVDDQTKRDIGGFEMALVDAAEKKIATARESIEGQVHYYKFELTPGRHRVAIAKDGYLPQSIVIMVAADGRDPTQIVALTREAKVPPVPEALAPGRIAVQVVDAATLQPITQATVSFSSKGAKVKNSVSPMDAKGWVVASLDPGEYSVSASKAGYQPSKEFAIDVASKKEVSQIVSLRRIETPTPPIPPPTSALSLTIVAVDESGKAIDGARVALLGTAVKSEFREAAGTYTAVGLATGSYEIAVDKAGYEKVTTKVSVGFTDAKKTVILKRLAAPDFELRVTALDDQGNAVSDLRPKSDPGIVIVADVKHYVTRLKPGTYQVRVERTGFEPVIQEIALSSDRQLLMNLMPTTKLTKKTQFSPLDANQDGKVDAADFSPEGWTRVKTADANGDGILDVDEIERAGLLRPASSAEVKTPAAGGDGGLLIKSLDRNGDGRVDSKDFSASNWEQLQQMGAVKNGVLDPEKLSRIAAPARDPLAKSVVNGAPTGGEDDALRRLMSSLDANRNGKIDRAEVRPELWQQIAEFDSDGDGALSPNECRPLLRERSTSPIRIPSAPVETTAVQPIVGTLTIVRQEPKSQ